MKVGFKNASLIFQKKKENAITKRIKESLSRFDNSSRQMTYVENFIDALENAGIETVPVSFLEVDVETLLIIGLKIELGTSDKVRNVTYRATLNIRADVGKVRNITVVDRVDELVVCSEDGRLCSLDSAEHEISVHH